MYYRGSAVGINNWEPVSNSVSGYQWILKDGCWMDHSCNEHDTLFCILGVVLQTISDHAHCMNDPFSNHLSVSIGNLTQNC
jgi:hypothetical protein